MVEPEKRSDGICIKHKSLSLHQSFGHCYFKQMSTSIQVRSSALCLSEFLFPCAPLRWITLSNLLSGSGVELEVTQSEFLWTNPD